MPPESLVDSVFEGNLLVLCPPEEVLRYRTFSTLDYPSWISIEQESRLAEYLFKLGEYFLNVDLVTYWVVDAKMAERSHLPLEWQQILGE